MSKEKTNLFLDLDQTLIFAVPFEDDKKANKKKFPNTPSYNMDNVYIIYERPHLQEFLDYAFANFNVSVWTAASKEYAMFIVEKIILIKPERKLNFIFYHHHCKSSTKHKNGTKDLTCIEDVFNINGIDLSNTIILDDYDEVYETQKTNCVIAPIFDCFDPNSKEDNFFPKLIEHAKKVDLNSPKKLSNNVKKINQSL